MKSIIVPQVPKPLHFGDAAGQVRRTLVELSPISRGANDDDVVTLSELFGRFEELADGILRNETSNEKNILAVLEARLDGEFVTLVAAVGNEITVHAEVVPPSVANRMRVEDQPCRMLRCPMRSRDKDALPQAAPFVPFPLDAIHIDDRRNPAGAKEREPKAISDVHHQSDIRPAPNRTERGRQTIREGTQRPGFEALRDNRANSRVTVWIIKHHASGTTINGYVPIAFCQVRGDTPHSRLESAVVARIPSGADDRHCRRYYELPRLPPSLIC